MIDWPIPKSLKALRGFLGLTRYYRRFVANYSRLAWPLTQQLKKDAFLWTEEAKKAFNQLKGVMASLSVLALPDFSKPFVVETDASGVGLGAVLMQEEKPLAYFSHKLSPQAQGKLVYEKELMAMVLAIKKWRPYLLGQNFLVRTDQKSLKYLLEQRVVEGEHHKWLLKLLSYNFDIQYKPGKDNTAADALSRLPAEMTFATISTPFVLDFEDIANQVAEDPYLTNIIKVIVENPAAYPHFCRVGTTLRYKGRVVLSTTSPFIPYLLREFHCSPIGGHRGVRQTYNRLSSEFHWRGIKRDVQNFVSNCDVCQRHKYGSTSPAGLMQPLPIPHQVWDDISMDFIEGLPKSKGRDTILVVVDRLSKYAHFLSLSHPFSALQVAHLFLTEIIKLHGIPRSIVSDRDKIFLSTFWSELFRLLGSDLRRSSAYHPQTDGHTEVVNRCVETYLICFSADKPSRWLDWLAWAEYNYNTSFHTATNMTPFKVVYSRDPPPVIRYEWGSTANQEVESVLLCYPRRAQVPPTPCTTKDEKAGRLYTSRGTMVSWGICICQVAPLSTIIPSTVEVAKLARSTRN